MSKRLPRRILRPGRQAELKKNPGVHISEHEIRQLFNNSGLQKRITDGELQGKVSENGHPSPPLADEPICTRSQILSYSNSDGKLIAKCHRYLRPDGTLGASKKLDPKMILVDDTIYYSDKL